jgi:hypothetical protein
MSKKNGPGGCDARAGTLQTSTASTNTNSNPPVQARPTYVLALRPLPSCRDPIVQVRRLLKHALRYYGLRCTSIEEVQP